MKMKTYIDQLRADSETANLRCDEAKSKTYNVAPRVMCDIPLRTQIESLMCSLSPAQRNRPWSMDELLVRLQGRYSARPHAMNVGQTLRAMGWVKKRDWTLQGAGKRYWYIGNE